MNGELMEHGAWRADGDAPSPLYPKASTSQAAPSSALEPCAAAVARCRLRRRADERHRRISLGNRRTNHGLARPAPSPAVHGAPSPGLIPCLVGALLSRPDPSRPSPPVVPCHRRAARRRMALGLLGVAKGAQLRVGARAAVTCPPPPVLSGLLRHHVLSNTNQWSCRPGLLLAAIRREGPWPGPNLHQVKFWTKIQCRHRVRSTKKRRVRRR